MDVETQVPKALAHGIRINHMQIGALIEVKTANRTYIVENAGGGRMRIHGHPKHCPKPVLVDHFGSMSLYSPDFINAGCCLAYRHPWHGTIRTSRVERVRELALRLQ